MIEEDLKEYKELVYSSIDFIARRIAYLKRVVDYKTKIID